MKVFIWSGLITKSIGFCVLTLAISLQIDLLSIAHALSNEQPKKVAWVVGNANYSSPDRLNNPGRDADRVAATLKDLGFKVNLQVNVNQQALLDGLSKFKTESTDADIALMYYAGHGLALQGENYVIPVDRSLASWSGQSLKTQALSLGQIEASLKTAKSQHILMVVDACRTPVFRSSEIKTMVEPKAKQGVLYLFSTLPGALARDGTGDYSPFNTSFVQALKRSDLSLKQQIAQIKSEMDASTAGTQIPWVADGLPGDLNLQSAKAFKAPSKAQIDTMVAQRTRGSEQQDEPKAFWSKYLQTVENEIQMLVEQTDAPRLAELKKRAELGDTTAQVALGYLYLRRNPPAPQGGNPFGGFPPGTKMYDLARIHEGPYTRTVKRDPKVAFKYLSQASEKGSPLADTVLGEMYYEGDGVDVDYGKSRIHLEKSAELGHGRARLNLLQLNVREGNKIDPNVILQFFKINE